MKTNNPYKFAFGHTWQSEHNFAKAQAEAAKVKAEENRSLQVNVSPLFKNLVANTLPKIDPVAFEGLVKVIFELLGFAATLTKLSGDDGIDINLKDPQGKLTVVQCKRYADDQYVSPREVRELIGSMAYSRAEYGIFVTSSKYSTQAKSYSVDSNLILIDGDELKRILLTAEEIYHNRTAFSDSLKDPSLFLKQILTQAPKTIV